MLGRVEFRGLVGFNAPRLALYLRSTCATCQIRTKTRNPKHEQRTLHHIGMVVEWRGRRSDLFSSTAPSDLEKEIFCECPTRQKQKVNFCPKIWKIWKSGGGVGTGFSLRASSPLLVASQALTLAIR